MLADSPVELKVRATYVDLVAPDFDVRFKSREAFQRFRAWVETARIVGEGSHRPVQTPLTREGREEWYVLAMGDGTVALQHFSSGDVDFCIQVTEERWREIGHIVMESTGEV